MSRVLMVCMGNICRSPTAEAVMRKHLQEHGLSRRVQVDSAGLESYHVGDAPDRRAQAAARQRGYDLSGLRARRVVREDFAHFDHILAADRSVLNELRRLCPSEYAARLGLCLDYSQSFKGQDIPDPYYGRADGFERVLDMTEDMVSGLLQSFGVPHEPKPAGPAG